MFSPRPLDARKGWLLVLFVCGMFGFASAEHEAAEAVSTVTCSVGIGCTLWVIWQLMRYDER